MLSAIAGKYRILEHISIGTLLFILMYGTKPTAVITVCRPFVFDKLLTVYFMGL